MQNTVFSSKSLLASIGTNSNNTQNDDKNFNQNTNDGSFLLASTLSTVPEPEDEKGDKNSIKPNSVTDNYNTEVNNDDIKDNSDNESISSDIIMNSNPDEKHKSTIKSKTLQLLPLLNPSNLLNSHDLLLNAFYEEHRLELVSQKKLSMRVITWNLNQMKPPSLKSLAGKSGREWAAFFYAGDSTVNEENKEGLADIYSINFQETISLTSFSKNDNVIDEWVNFLLAVLNAICSNSSYSLVYKTGLLGLTSIILAKQYLSNDQINELDGQIHNIRQNTLGLGYLRWANKGCISLRFRIGGIGLGIGNYLNNKHSSDNINNIYSFDELDDTVGKIPGLEIQILNVHLVHGEDQSQVQQRWGSWAKIENKIGLDDRTVKLALDSSKIDVKDAAQKRLEMKLQQKLNSQIQHKNNLEKEMNAMHLNNDSVRTSSIPINFSQSEIKKFDGIISSVDLQKLLHVTEAQKGLVVCGDTNYRLALPADNTLNSKNTVQQLIKNGNWEFLLKHDQLQDQMKLKKVFIGFNEPDIHFAPTFKVQPDNIGNWIITPPSSAESVEKPVLNEKRIRRPVPGTPTESSASTENTTPPYYVPKYDNKRLPAYTDRILYVSRPYFKVAENSYTSTGNAGSDHLPVACTYILEAPLIDEKKQHYLKSKFTTAWDEIINKMVFLKMNSDIIIKHSLLGYKEENLESKPKSIDETIKSDGGNIKFTAIVGETLKIIIKFENTVDEPFNLCVKEQTSSGWFTSKVDINCQQVGTNETAQFLNKSTSSSIIDSHSQGEITLTIIPSSPGLFERMFYSEIPEYSLCPAYRKFFALTIDVKDIFSASFEEITPEQFSNIDECFNFICNENNIVGLLDYIEDLKDSGDLKTIEWNLVREVTLWTFSKAKYSQMNKDGIEAVKRREPEKFNLGSKTVLAFLYIWLKSQNNVFNTDTKRGQTIFSNVINLIKYLKLDSDDAYSWFGWLFANEFELEGYLERDFDVKVQL
ncbi:Synaptojanin-2 [Pichia californica]|uniref:Synaptojanin-2 n=1 Tax=Pichia californica TaxID=460514 RepID=A0A9P7BHS8_9ASCO|nr:Synaptojanin-2 [[Candida] californica]